MSEKTPITDNLFFPVTEQLEKQGITTDDTDRRNWWYEPSIQEILEECEYILDLAWK